MNGMRDGCELNSTSSLFDACAIHLGHVHGKPFDCDGNIGEYVADGCCTSGSDGLVVTTVVNGDCFGGLCRTDGLLA